MSDIEYFSEDEYNYESDGSTMDYDSDDSTECKSPVIALPNVDYLIPENVKQYQWTKWCLQMSKFFEHECQYDIEENHTISFIYDKKGFSLTIPLDGTEYPFIPPKVSWIGEYIPLSDIVLITHNKQLCVKNWNICVDLTRFVSNALDIIRDTIDTPISPESTTTMLAIVDLLGNKYEFDCDKDDLPRFDLQQKLKLEYTHSHYLRNGEKIVKICSNEDRFGKFIAVILNDSDALQHQPLCIEIISDFVTMLVASFQFTKLEVSMNEEFYKNLLLVNNRLELSVDLSQLKAIVDSLENIEVASDEKVFFVDDFDCHVFKSSVSLVRPKFVKRVMSEIDALRDAVKDFHGYIAISESNIQLMKFMLIPDYDTPYGGGYFEFDVFITGDYPSSPPKVKFLTTDSGKIRFNPNLYNSGKVCLSILNTWANNQWDPKSSTLTQVVLSINSMVFIEHPYTNEPAFYDALKTQDGRNKSEQYNVAVRRDTIHAAVVQQLGNKNTPFRDIIAKHWQESGETTKRHYVDNFGLSIDA